MNILGISAYYHDSAAAIIIDGEVIAAAQEERFSRIKHDADFPLNAVRFCLEFADLRIDDLDAIVFYDKPLLKFERLIESYHAKAPKGLFSFLKAMPVWMKQKLALRKTIGNELQKLQSFDKKKLKLLFSEHHLSHAASAFYVSPFKEAAIITIDGVGEWATSSIFLGSNNEITKLKELRFPHSLGLLYSAFTYYCGFRVNSGEYKLMGLAPYGNEDSSAYKEIKQKIEQELCTIYDDGSLVLQQDYFSYVSQLKMVNEEKWENLFGFPARLPESSIDQQYCDMALAIQKITEEIVIKTAAHAAKLTGQRNVCLAGGVALNCVANGLLQKSGIFENIYIQPAAGDAGGALGAALAVSHLHNKEPRLPLKAADGMKNAYLGPAFSNSSVLKMLHAKRAVFVQYSNAEIIERAADHLQNGKIAGWFQGRMEFGPRALGNRSILAKASDAGMQQRLNLKIKYRESFRPFAPVCKIENTSKYFDINAPSPYMLFTSRLCDEYNLALPANFQALGMKEKLNTIRSKYPSITHIDYSCRLQTISKEANHLLWDLLDAFEKISGEGILINTSFNVRGEPIVCTPAEAYDCFMNTEMDVLVINDFLLIKEDQPIKEKQSIKDHLMID